METENLAVNDAELGDTPAIETHSEQDEKAFLSTLDDDSQDFDPTSVKAKEDDKKAETEAAAGVVFIGLMTVEQTMKTLVHPEFGFDPDQSEAVAYKVAPLIVKYGGNPPPWLAAYMDEIMAVAAIGMLAISSWMQVKQLKAADIAAAKEKAKQAANDDHQQEAA
ncbi:hypothetical protein [Photobacterium chitinilyticum]|uniref:Uncharacterized protein n=1 Tax=Photobacterium chitinilyticum TaxID=2485123 RepID=A0A444JPG3_9GAMM|nr:hypothetical protein [Photobacterium chitinilyticum]RWX54976.1 hypothetical protein EDI28_14655 [Photobacterium chitinilyticum]